MRKPNLPRLISNSLYTGFLKKETNRKFLLNSMPAYCFFVTFA
ncbi:hypothetical protein EMA8858_03190 [Emticicia aquatica]|uniref:Uncharacterized protein n=1 Tax=Emticicia aquatica TaxID=1681835 RepID=A0ABN8EYX7_9BACT|nr:hypothetical protein EMA8858_03190 [Emticicia aquatica]